MKIIIILLLVFATISINAETLPKLNREFRAVWIATVDNVDFPTKKNLTIAEQKAELIRSLDLALELKLNAVVFQVRPMCDAVYNSKIEPWSEFLTGTMGEPQNFDPLQFIIEAAHKRGILVHAWFNPYRAYHPLAKTISENHISKRRPDLVRNYGKYLWLDPGEPEVQDYSASVIVDVVKRYDVDGVHFDDYFYPYPEKDADGKKIDFPDEKSWQKYLQTGVNMSRQSGVRRIPLKRDDWRRANVNNFIERVGREIKKIKPQILYGISPFGIWQPVPEKNISGFNAYTGLYANAKKWLQDGTVDYLTPQLYWATAQQGQSYPVLLEWWQNQNTKKRHLWTGIATYRIGSNPDYPAQEIINQIETSRRVQPTAGNVEFSFKSLRNNLGNVQELLQSGVYKNDAIIPLSSWIKAKSPLAPKVQVKKVSDKIRIDWSEQGTVKAFWFVVYAKDKVGWSYSILPAATKSISLSANRQISKVAITGVDRLGNESLAKQLVVK